MRRWVMLVLFVGALAFQAGCGGSGMAYAPAERWHRAKVIMENDWKQYADDVDLFWLNDQNLRTSKWKME